MAPRLAGHRDYDSRPIGSVSIALANGIPRRHTIARILRCIVIDTLLEALLCWVNEQRTHQGKPIIAFDGKVLRDSFRGNAKDALQLVTAYDTENGLVLSQKATPNKKEIRNRQRDAGHS